MIEERFDTVDFDTPHGTLEDVPARVLYDVEEVVLEPYSYGWDRGVELHVSATIGGVVLGDLRLSREDLVKWIGNEAVKEMEDNLADSYEADEGEE